MVVAQLVERSLPTAEVRRSNPVIEKKLDLTFTVNSIEKTKKEKEARIGPNKKSSKNAKINNFYGLRADQ